MTTIRVVGASVVAMLGCLFLLATGGGAQTARQMTGRGDWQSSAGGEYISGTWTITLQRVANRVTGTMELTGSNVLTSGSITGTINGQNIILGVGSDGVSEATFSGRLAGDAISGEWDCPAVKDQGVWSGTLSSAK